ncbi:MAG: UvrD-helicase domain-containing protein, partial [Planctomycetes bacterium]|nr:UvrD-helicase domain-containing protein [Planctomycetota bacterium]
MIYADLHVHSKYSRATSKETDLEHLALWAGKKGVSVLGTGDFTHPAWLGEIRERLVPAEPGLFRLRDDAQREVDALLPRACAAAVRFMLQVEISTIYMKAGRTRKVHHLIYAPGLEQAAWLQARLAALGNVKSDGRPILGLDSRDLLEIVLECGAGCFLVPAHVWTPWFAALGSKSGFDSIEECYGDLHAAVFALETGLSSDPAMNWRVSRLDRFRLTSSSDAHSPPKIAREACVFDTELDYFAMRRALETGAGYRGTIEFFPEEGKYHLDGHRACGVRFTPQETRASKGLCPACGRALTVGVMSRVEELADRPAGARPQGASAFQSLVPLAEVVAEILGVRDKSCRVQAAYEGLLAALGPELFILQQAPLEDVRRAGHPQLAEALARMRAGRVLRDAGYDGVYGVIRLFEKHEIRSGGASLFFELKDAAGPRAAQATPSEGAARPASPPERTAPPASPAPFAGLDPEQHAAAEAPGPLLVVAGPGTGKTRVLAHRIAHLIRNGGHAPGECLALTFSRRAAAELGQRLEALLPGQARDVPCLTFHALALGMLRGREEALGFSRPMRLAGDEERSALVAQARSVSERSARALLSRISRQKRAGAKAAEDAEDAALVEEYQRLLREHGLFDFDDLILLATRLLETDPALRDEQRRRFRAVSIDEFQDIDAAQYRLIRQLVPPAGNACAIGDPDQSIYGFRGADPLCFRRFLRDYPAARTVRLETNYRSSRAIVDAAMQVIEPATLVEERALRALSQSAERIEICPCPSERAEAEFVVHSIERLVGGSSFFSLDSGRVAAGEGEALSFADFAVLYRTEAQAGALCEALERSGMPYQRKSHQRLCDDPAVLAILRRVEDAEPGAADLDALLEQAVAEVAREHPDAARRAAALCLLAERCAGDRARLQSELALGVDVDSWDPRADRVSLLTLHAAKGLEFAVVFLVGCEDGILPLRFGAEEDRDLAEERRLFFVGMTRARERLILSHARRRAWRGARREMA